MPFGLCNEPATFERLVSQVMRGQHWKRCLVYIDDILVFDNEFESALHSLELVLNRVAEYGLQLKSTKCNLFRTSVPFLGHIVGRAGLECDPNKLSAVANWIPPSTIKGVREFLGFTGYYRRFVPDYSTVAQPLVRLLGKDCKFQWTDDCQDAFRALRALLIKAPVLAFPKEDLPYIVDTDASDYGIGGVLSQSIEGTEHVIAYYSKSLNPTQQKYCTTRRELLAVVATLDHFKGYVWGPKFLVRTDHAALVWLTNLKNIQGMLARWLAKLQQFNFDIVHRPGAQHGNADGLSRCPQCERGACAPTTNTHQTDPDQPYAYSCGGSSLDSELIPLESGETCVVFGKEKSKVMKMGSSVQTELKLGDMEIEETDKYKYLGEIINNKGNLEDHIKMLEGKVEAAYQTILHIAKDKNFKGLKMAIIWKLVETCIIPIITYGAESTTTTHKESQKIQTIMNNIIKRILQVPQSTPNDAITIETGILNIQTITEIKQLNSHMRINKMDQNREIKQTWNNSKRWKQHIDKINKKYNINIRGLPFHSQGGVRVFLEKKNCTLIFEEKKNCTLKV